MISIAYITFGLIVFCVFSCDVRCVCWTWCQYSMYIIWVPDWWTLRFSGDPPFAFLLCILLLCFFSFGRIKWWWSDDDATKSQRTSTVSKRLNGSSFGAEKLPTTYMWYKVEVEQGLTSHQTHYRSYRGQVLQVKWPNQQCQSTEGRWVLRTRLQSHQVHPTVLTIG